MNENETATKLDLTFDELVLAGNGYWLDGQDAYLNIKYDYWTNTAANMMVPFNFVWILGSSGGANSMVDWNCGVRPAIFLKNGIDYVSGTGTAFNPYVVE